MFVAYQATSRNKLRKNIVDYLECDDNPLTFASDF